MFERYLATIVLAICCLTLNAQENVDSVLVDNTNLMVISKQKESKNENYKDSFYKKYKIEKTIAWTALGIGTGALLVSTICDIGCQQTTRYRNDKPFWETIVVCSLGTQLASIPLFILAHKNKKKWKGVDFSVDNIAVALPDGNMTRQTAFCVYVNF